MRYTRFGAHKKRTYCVWKLSVCEVSAIDKLISGPISEWNGQVDNQSRNPLASKIIGNDNEMIQVDENVWCLLVSLEVFEIISVRYILVNSATTEAKNDDNVIWFRKYSDCRCRPTIPIIHNTLYLADVLSRHFAEPSLWQSWNGVMMNWVPSVQLPHACPSTLLDVFNY